MDTEDNSVNMGNMGIHGGTRRGIMKGRARKPRSMSPLRTKSKSRKHGGAEEEEMEGGARRAVRKHGGAEEEEMDGGARRKPRRKSPLRKRGGAEEEEMDGGARRKPKSRKHGGAEEEEMEGGARRKPIRKSPLRKRGGAEEEEMDGGARRGKKKTSRYIMFVKRRMCDMKKTDPGLPQVEKMRKIAAEWKANK